MSSYSDMLYGGTTEPIEEVVRLTWESDEVDSRIRVRVLVQALLCENMCRMIYAMPLMGRINPFSQLIDVEKYEEVRNRVVFSCRREQCVW
jgi:hypothetical protein